MQSNAAIDHYINDDVDFELDLKTRRQINRSKEEQVRIRRQIEEIVAEKQMIMALSEPYGE